ncbi:alpha/beta fold hydrolase [Microbacterium sp. NIBRBAC000506063]|uniref:alpha/beta fold hydrolase n=1 Tax=Microbacterium sp. NIBRBAC000506063 TaxID=2734618 RepID=UPI002948B772|nr:alpha/beta fold hydrolase [Microbacterium sp. NIBRBAC000506063]
MVDGVVPFPGWDFFDDEDVSDLDATTRERTAPLARSVPVRVPTDPIPLGDERRFDVPVVVLSGGFDHDELVAALAKWGPYGDEAAAVKDFRVVRIGSGHWPQFSVPERLAELIVAGVSGA